MAALRTLSLIFLSFSFILFYLFFHLNLAFRNDYTLPLLDLWGHFVFLLPFPLSVVPQWPSIYINLHTSSS